MTQGPERPPTCTTCGATCIDADQEALARLTWSRGREAGREVWTCASCVRTHARAIEGNLDSAWW